MKPVADAWFSIDVYAPDVLLLRESHVDPYTVGDIWIARGRDRDLVVDTGYGSFNTFMCSRFGPERFRSRSYTRRAFEGLNF